MGWLKFALVYLSFYNISCYDEGYYDTVYGRLVSQLKHNELIPSQHQKLHTETQKFNEVFSMRNIFQMVNNVGFSQQLLEDTGNFNVVFPADSPSNDTTEKPQHQHSTAFNDTTGEPQLTTTFDVTTDEPQLTTVFTNTAQTSQTTSESPLPNVSPLCWNHTSSIFPGILQRKPWAIQMLDAVGKPNIFNPSKLTNQLLGDFGECQAVRAKEFDGQYCFSKIYVATIPNPTTGKLGVEIQIGICVPSTCSMTDVVNMINTVAPTLSNKTVYATGGTCQKPTIPYDTKAIAALSVIAVFASLIIMATFYDVMIQRLNKKKQNQNSANEKPANGKINNGFHDVSSLSDPEKNGQILASENDKQHKFKESNGFTPVDKRTEKMYKPSVLGKLLLSFSVYSNAPKILSAKQSSGTLTAVNGIRFLSMSWVILGHTYAFGFNNVSNMANVYVTMIKRKSFMAILNAEVSVDTFFALSGTLLAYVALKQMDSGKGKLNWFMFYFHRFWRLTPPYMMIMMIQIILFRYFGSGPKWPQNGSEKNYCENTWYWNLLYINNFKKGGDECFGHAWYLANDMQFYVISPVILLALYHSKIAGRLVTGGLWVATAIATAVVSVHFQLGPLTFGRNAADYFDQYYQRPYCRIGPYLVGLYTGYLLYKTKCTFQIQKYMNLIVWLVFAVSACAVLYGVYDDANGNPMSIGVAALYNTVHKTVWGMSVCWVIFACATGNGGFVNTILSWKGFVPLSRLTYCAYLFHPMIQYYYYYSRKQLIFWDDHEIIYEFLAHLTAAYGVAFIASLAFESPMMGLEKVVFKRDRKKK